MIKKKKIDHEIPPLLEKLKLSLENDPDIIFCFLFGSYGKNQISPLSDVDLAFYLREDVNTFEKKLDLIEITGRLLGTDEIDLVILNEAPATLVREIINTGKVLICKDENKMIEFEIRKLREFFDTQFLREFSEKQLIRRIKKGQYGSSCPC